jgi:hypothetical protein
MADQRRCSQRRGGPSRLAIVQGAGVVQGFRCPFHRVPGQLAPLAVGEMPRMAPRSMLALRIRRLSICSHETQFRISILLGRMTRFRKILLLAVVPFAALLFMVSWPSLQRVNTAAHAAMCKNNLKVLENAEAKWAQEQHKTTNDTPTWSDLVGTNRYLETRIACPDGGIITIGRVGVPPTCSVPGHNL